MTTAIHRRVEALRAGQDPTFIARLASGWAVLGDPQVLPGYCLLLPDPVVSHLNDFDGAARSRFLADVAALGDAVLAATGALRINYAMFGNLEPALHAHVIPRYAHEPEVQQPLQPWALDWDSAPRFDAASHGALRERVHAALGRAGVIGARGRVHHLDLTVDDLAAATAFYEAVLPLMGFRRMPDCPEGPIWLGDAVEIGLQPARRARAARPLCARPAPPGLRGAEPARRGPRLPAVARAAGAGARCPGRVSCLRSGVLRGVFCRPGRHQARIRLHAGMNRSGCGLPGGSA